MNTYETPAASYRAPDAAGQTGAGPGADRGTGPALPPPCVCSTPGLRHLNTAHKLAGDNRTRKACSWVLGPKGTPCGCKRYEPEVTR